MSSNSITAESFADEVPLIGVAMATYNPCLSYFVDQVSSLKNQTYKNWKCILVDDCSSEQKFRNIVEVIGDDHRFEIYRNSHNLGSFKTFERALTLMPEKTDLICFCDQDDIWISTKLEIQLQSFYDSSVFLVHTDQSLIDEKNRVFAASCWNLEGRGVLEATTDLLLFRNLITGCTTMFRQEVLKTALPFSELRPSREMYHHDMWVAMHACVHGKVLGLKEPLVLYRQHSGNLVGVSRLRKNVKFSQLAMRATNAFRERLGLREDFLRSLEQHQLIRHVQVQRNQLDYLDKLTYLGLKGLQFVRKHPLFLRTWVMLAVGLISINFRKILVPRSEKVF